MATSKLFGFASLFAAGAAGALVASALAGAPAVVAHAAAPLQTDNAKDVVVVNSSPIPVSGTLNVGNLPVDAGKLLVQPPATTYGYGQQSLSSDRTIDIPAGVVLTDLIVKHLVGDSPCWMYLKEIVPYNGGTALMAIDSLYPATGAPAELHLKSGIPSDGDLGTFVNGNCTVHTMWTGYLR